MTPTPELKPCPFCGGEPTVEPWHGGAPTKIMICCSNHQYHDEDGGCSVGPMVTGETEQEAASRWNRRALSALHAKTGLSIEPVAWLRLGEPTPVQGVPFGANWITDKDDPLGFPVYAHQPASALSTKLQEPVGEVSADTIMKSDVETMIKSWQSECKDHPALHNQGNVLLSRLEALKPSLAMSDFLSGMATLTHQPVTTGPVGDNVKWLCDAPAGVPSSGKIVTSDEYVQKWRDNGWTCKAYVPLAHQPVTAGLEELKDEIVSVIANLKTNYTCDDVAYKNADRLRVALAALKPEGGK